MKRTKIFFDTEFTGLHQQTSLISIGLVSECGRSFYAELNDYDVLQVFDWVKENVIKNLLFEAPAKGEDEYYLATNHSRNKKVQSFYKSYSVKLRCNSLKLKKELSLWLSQFDCIEMWSDCLAYDWVLFNNIFGTAFDIPENVFYIPFDICTLFELKGIDPDINRDEFVGEIETKKHNALYDAQIIRRCYTKLMTNIDLDGSEYHITYYPDPSINVLKGYNFHAPTMQEVILNHSKNFPNTQPYYIIRK